jgi:hypothetical protein
VSRIVALTVCWACIAVSAQAASLEDDPRALRRIVVSTCLKASTLEDARPVGETFRYNDRVAHVALLLSGRRTHASGESAKGYELCLYDERAGTASVVTADGLIEAP